MRKRHFYVLRRVLHYKEDSAFEFLDHISPKMPNMSGKSNWKKDKNIFTGMTQGSQKREGQTQGERLSVCGFSNLLFQLLLAGRNTADGVRNFVFGSSVAT